MKVNRYSLVVCCRYSRQSHLFLHSIRVVKVKEANDLASDSEAENGPAGPSPFRGESLRIRTPQPHTVAGFSNAYSLNPSHKGEGDSMENS